MMLKASKALYLISAILAGVSIVLCIVMACISDTITKLIEESAKTYWKELPEIAVEWIKIGMMIGAVVGAILCALQLGLSVYGCVAIGKGSTNVVPHIVMIVFGVFGNLFLLIGGILAVAELYGNRNNRPADVPTQVVPPEEKN